LPDFTGPEVVREAFEPLLKALEILSLFLELSVFLDLGLAVVARDNPVVGSTFSLSASSANKEVELDAGRPKERAEPETDERGLEEDARVVLALTHGGSWKIMNVGAIVKELIDVEIKC
jgi:hypothetical protein